MNALIRRLPLVLGIALVCMAAGAGWAGLATPAYRSTAVVTSTDADLQELARSDEVTFEFRNRVRQRFGGTVANSAVGFAVGSADRVEISTESNIAGTTQDMTEMYLDAMLTVAPSLRVEQAATFPQAPHSPNLGRLALLSALGGLGIGGGVALIAESRRKVAADVTPAPAKVVEPVASPKRSRRRSKRELQPIRIAPLQVVQETQIAGPVGPPPAGPRSL